MPSALTFTAQQRTCQKHSQGTAHTGTRGQHLWQQQGGREGGLSVPASHLGLLSAQVSYCCCPAPCWGSCEAPECRVRASPEPAQRCTLQGKGGIILKKSGTWSGGAPASPAVQRHVCALGIEQPFSPWSILPAQCQPVASLVTSSNIYDAGSESLSHSEKPQSITAQPSSTAGTVGQIPGPGWAHVGPGWTCPRMPWACFSERCVHDKKIFNS